MNAQYRLRGLLKRETGTRASVSAKAMVAVKGAGTDAGVCGCGNVNELLKYITEQDVRS